MDYTGLLGDGNQFDRGSADFVLGEEKVIKGWEEGFTGQCAGEKITMIVPPSLGYGDQASDKVPANSTLYFLTTLDGIVRVTKAPLGGDCNEGVKARPGQDVTMKIKAKVSQPDGRGKIFFDKPSFAYGSTGNRNGSVPPNSTVHVEVEVVRVRNKKPDSDIGLGFLERLAAGTARLPNGR